MEVTKAEIDAVLDAQGRFVWTPNALTLDGQQNVPCDLQPGESLEAFLRRHVPGIDSGAWSVSIGGCVVPRAMWGKTYPKHGMHIACRAVVAKQVVQLVAVAALSYFTLGMGGIAAGSFMGLTGAAGWAAAMGVFVAGSVLINKVLGPKTPKVGTPEEAKQVYSLRSQRNSARPYEPIPVLWGEMGVVQDLASQPYTWHQSEDQYLSTILLGGINVHSAADLAIGDTPISSYQDVEVYYNGFSGMSNQKIPLSSNMDSLAGGAIDDDETWVTRTSSPGAIQLAVDLEYVMYLQGNKGLLWAHSDITVQYRKVGTSEWRVLTGAVKRIGNNKAEPRRVTWQQPVDEGQYEVRMKQKKVARTDQNGTNGFRQVSWVSLRSTQPDTTDYTQFGRIGIKIKATGQISGSLDTVRVTYRAKPMPIWTGTAWTTATTRENGLSNPGAILLQTLRGIWHKGKLQFGFGLSDDQIDIDGLKAFMLHCTAKGYTYDKWITSSMSLQEFCQEVALAGMGEFSWTDGSRPTVVFVSAGQPVSAVVNMANMLKASFSVDYALSNAADGIEYQYVDRAKNFETVTLRVAAPGVTTALNPARIKGEGVTTEAHAAIMARYHLAQSLYQYKTIHFGADIEHLDYRRLSVLSVSHDLTQWGYGGRVMGAWRSGGQVLIQLDEPVPPLPTPHLGLRLPGDRDYRVFAVQTLEEASDTLVLTTPWPAGVALPGEGDDAHDTLWCYDFKATPGYRVRVTSMEPEQDLKGAKVTCVPEGPEFWDYVLNGTYVPAPSQTVLPQHARASVKNLRVTEHVNVQGDTEWYELSALWDVEGDYDHAQVWAGVDGSELQLVDANAVGSRTRFRIDGPGQWLVEVRPFNAGGQVGQAAAALYITAMVQRAPRNVDDFTVQELAGGLRRFAWQYTGDKPPALAGVQIRYVPGDVALSTDMWGDMTPLGQPDDVYKAQFETTRPEAGLWTFGIRAIDTAGQLSSGVVRFVAGLGDSFEQVQQPDVTPPPVPTGLAATGAFATVQVSWDVPVYDQGHGHSRTEVWAGVTADIADAAKVAEAYAGPASFEWTLGSTAYVWARHVTNDGVAGDWAGPVTAQTAQDVAALGEVLKGQITQSQLHADLSGRVDMIDVLDVGRPELGVATGLIQATAALADADAAEALQRQQLAARLDQEDAALLALVEQEQQARVSGDQAEAAARQALAVRLDGKDGQLQAAIQAEQQARADAVSAEASARQTLAVTVSSNHSAALAAAQAASDAAGSKGKVIFGASAPAVADRLAQNLWIDSTGGANTPKRWNGSAWVAVTDKAATDAAAAAAQAQATANNAVAAIQTEQSVRANETGHLGAQYTVRMQLGQGGQQVVGGFGLSGTSSQTAGARLDFGVLANSFWVAAPNGSGVANVKPFSVQTTAQTVNGVVVPAGVYMDAAYIRNVTVLWARFGTLVADSIQATAISASQLTAGNGVIGGSLKSSNYVSGSSGWTLRPDGVAEFSGVIVRGTVYATSGAVGGWSIGSNYLRSSNYQAGVRGVNFGSDGSVEIRSTDGTRTFNLQATGTQALLAVPGLSILGNGSATFSGNLSGASGSFSGTLTASNIINTSHLVNGAVSSSVASYETDVLSFRYDTETTVATVHVGTSGGRVLILAGLSLEVTNGRITSSYNPRCTVRLRRNGSEVRRLEIRGEYGAASQQAAPSMRYQYATWIKEGPVALLPMVDTPPSGVNTYTITLTVVGMDTDVNITVRHRSMAAMELKR